MSQGRNNKGGKPAPESAGRETEVSALPRTAKRTEPTLYHLLLFQIGHEQIERQLVHNIQMLLDRSITTEKKDTRIDLWLQSPGGDADAAYKLFLDLRSRCSQLRAVIPDYAKSAATLLLFGVDEIYMAPAAELGPLDVQIEHPDRENVGISGLDVTDSLHFLALTGMEIANKQGLEIFRNTLLPRQVVLHESLQFMYQFLQPVVAKIDPHILHQAANLLSVAQQYALRMLRARNVPLERQLNPDAAEELVVYLINKYPAHGFVISRDEARLLKLPVEDAETYDRWPFVKYKHLRYIHGLESGLQIIKDSEIDQMIQEITGGKEIEDETILQTDDTDTSQDGHLGISEKSTTDAHPTLSG